MQPRIFRTETVTQSEAWSSSTLPLPALLDERGPFRVARGVLNAVRARRHLTERDIIVVTDEHPVTGNVLGLLQRYRRTRPTIVRTDPLFHKPRSLMRSAYIRASFDAVDRLIVWSPAVADRYSRLLDIDRDKIVAVRFHHTLAGFPALKTTTNNYIFSGGDSMRDYVTLINAVRGLNTPVHIATHWRPPGGMVVPANVTIEAVSPLRFRELMAGAYMVVVPLSMDDLRTSGQQSYLNAMALGKAVVVTDDMDAAFYIKDKVTGMLVPSGNADALQRAIRFLLDNPATCFDLGRAAREAALPLDQEYTWSRVLDIARQTHWARTSA